MKRVVVYISIIAGLFLVFFLVLKFQNYKALNKQQSKIEALESSQQNSQSSVEDAKDATSKEINGLNNKIDKLQPLEVFYATNNNYLTNNYITQGSSGSTGTYVNLQAAAPGVPQIGSFNISGTGIAGILQGITLTDGTATLTGGAISDAITITATGAIQGGTLD